MTPARPVPWLKPEVPTGNPASRTTSPIPAWYPLAQTYYTCFPLRVVGANVAGSQRVLREDATYTAEFSG